MKSRSQQQLLRDHRILFIWGFMMIAGLSFTYRGHNIRIPLTYDEVDQNPSRRIDNQTASQWNDEKHQFWQQIFAKHCGGEAKILSSRSANPWFLDDLVPALFTSAVLHCPGSSLPYPSVDVWYHHADIRIVQGSQSKDVALHLEALCNQRLDGKACVIFLDTSLIHDVRLGASMLHQMLRRPFILITANNDDECVPYSTVPRQDTGSGRTLSPDIDALIQSPLLLRWYSKVSPNQRNIQPIYKYIYFSDKMP